MTACSDDKAAAPCHREVCKQCWNSGWGFSGKFRNQRDNLVIKEQILLLFTKNTKATAVPHLLFKQQFNIAAFMAVFRIKRPASPTLQSHRSNYHSIYDRKQRHSLDWSHSSEITVTSNTVIQLITEQACDSEEQAAHLLSIRKTARVWEVNSLSSLSFCPYRKPVGAEQNSEKGWRIQDTYPDSESFQDYTYSSGPHSLATSDVMRKVKMMGPALWCSR